MNLSLFKIKPILCFLFATLWFSSHNFAQSVYDEREADWRNGALVYQVIIDRFAPPADLESKRDLYPAPKVLRSWDEVPRQGTYNEDVEVWSHEIDFWGGDFESLMSNLDYIEDLGVDVLYLNPIHQAYTNHKYDAQDYFKVSPEYGTREDVSVLADDLHERGLKLMLDGVLNHMGRTSPYFIEAKDDENSEYRDWFVFDENYQRGYRGWYNVANLPELNLENEELRDLLWNDSDSLLQGYLRDGVDGWRLDVAYDIGYDYLRELTDAAHNAKEGSMIIGEIWNYPPEWLKATDALMNMVQREVILNIIDGDCLPEQGRRLMDRMVADVGDNYDGLLRSWVMIDNHDTPRLRTVLPEEWQQRHAQVLQFTLPGSPCIYYGVELGMEGGGDPEMRAPMRWDLVTDTNPYLNWFETLVELRINNRALRVGDYVSVETKNAFAFMRTTDRIEETVLVVSNPTNEEIKEFLMPASSSLMSGAQLKDQLSDTTFTCFAGTIMMTIPPQTVYVLKPVMLDGSKEYTPYKRVP